MARRKSEPAPSPAHVALMLEGCVRGLRAAAAYSGLSEQQLRELMDADLLPWFPLGERGDRMIPRVALAQLLATQYGRFLEAREKAT